MSNSNMRNDTSATYKVLEVSPVDEVNIEKELNRWTQKGWEFERIEFVSQDGVRRPVLAYIFLTAPPYGTEETS